MSDKGRFSETLLYPTKGGKLTISLSFPFVFLEAGYYLLRKIAT